MKQLPGAGPRNMPWAKKAVVCEGEGTFVFYHVSAYVSMFVVSLS
jgi:hypothetical protein